jgi:hypothetical protein
MARRFTRAEAERDYRDKHWGEQGTRGRERLRVADVTTAGELVLLGDLVSVTYRTRKFGDGDEAADYEHKFATPRPRLAYTAGGLLVIVGGRYKMSDRGIIG